MTGSAQSVPNLSTDALLDALLAHVPAAMIIHDRDLKIVRVNEVFHRITGHGDEVLGKSPFEFIPEPLLSKTGLKEKLPRVRDIGEMIGPEEIRYRAPDGRPIVFWHKVLPLYGPGGTVEFVVTMLQDMTEHAAIKEALERTVAYQEALLKEADDTRRAMLLMLEDVNASTAAIETAKKTWEETFDAISDPLFIHDQEFRIVRANRAYAKAADLPLIEAIGRPYYEVFPKADGPHKMCLKAMQLEEEQVLDQVSGKLFKTRFYGTQDAAGKLAHRIHIMEDITDRKLMERQAGRMEQLAAMGQLLSGIAHELKNPLFILTGRLQLMQEKLDHQEYAAIGPDLQKIEDAAMRMTKVAQRFLFLAKPAQPSLQWCTVQEVLLKVLDFLANELMKSRIRVAQTLLPDLPKIWSDPQQLHQVFLNLMLNAMQAMVKAHGQGTLTVRTARSDGWVEVRIQDDGPGIPPEHRAKIFEPFFTTKPAGEGTGLGLWIVQSSIMNMRGMVDCESEAGKGASFIVKLPIVPAAGSV